MVVKKIILGGVVGSAAMWAHSVGRAYNPERFADPENQREMAQAGVLGSLVGLPLGMAATGAGLLIAHNAANPAFTEPARDAVRYWIAQQ